MWDTIRESGEGDGGRGNGCVSKTRAVSDWGVQLPAKSGQRAQRGRVGPHLFYFLPPAPVFLDRGAAIVRSGSRHLSSLRKAVGHIVVLGLLLPAASGKGVGNARTLGARVYNQRAARTRTRRIKRLEDSPTVIM